MKSRSLFATLLCYIWSTLLVPGEAIIIHPNVPDSSYVTNVANVPFFVSLGQRGDCAGSVVVGSAAKNLFYVISAAHCFCANRRKDSRPTTVIFSDGSKVHDVCVFREVIPNTALSLSLSLCLSVCVSLSVSLTLSSLESLSSLEHVHTITAA